MYSMVLMMALSNSATIPGQYDVVVQGKEARYGNHLQSEHNRGRRGCHGRRRGCYGCWGGCYGCCGCWGGACYGGCWGGAYYGGCTGAVYSGCTGGACYGGCHGCAGYTRGYSAGYYGGWGAPSASSYSTPAYSGGYAGTVPAGSDYRYDYNRGYEGSERGYRSSDEFSGGRPDIRRQDEYQPPAASPETIAPRETGGTPSGGRSGTIPREESRAPGRATIVVQLPADARLSFNGHLTSSDSTERTFASPPLPTGKAFIYRLKAEIVRDGQPLVMNKQITVRADETVNVAFDFSKDLVGLK